MVNYIYLQERLETLFRLPPFVDIFRPCVEVRRWIVVVGDVGVATIVVLVQLPRAVCDALLQLVAAHSPAHQRGEGHVRHSAGGGRGHFLWCDQPTLGRPAHGHSQGNGLEDPALPHRETTETGSRQGCEERRREVEETRRGGLVKLVHRGEREGVVGHGEVRLGQHGGGGCQVRVGIRQGQRFGDIPENTEWCVGGRRGGCRW